MLSDGHALVPGARLAEDAPASRLGPAAKHAIARHQGPPLATIYLEVPSDDRVVRSTSLPSWLLMADVSPRLEWVEFPIAGPVMLPTILEQGRHRFVRVATGCARLIILRALSTATE